MCDQEPDHQRCDHGEPDHLGAVEEGHDSVDVPRPMAWPFTCMIVPKLKETTAAVESSHHTPKRSRWMMSQAHKNKHAMINGQPRKAVFSAPLAGKWRLALLSVSDAKCCNRLGRTRLAISAFDCELVTPLVRATGPNSW